MKMAKQPQNIEGNLNEPTAAQEETQQITSSEEVENQNNEIAADDTTPQSAETETNTSNAVAQAEPEISSNDAEVAIDTLEAVEAPKDTSLDPILDLIGELHDRVSALENNPKLAAKPEYKSTLDERLANIERSLRSAGLFSAEQAKEFEEPEVIQG